MNKKKEKHSRIIGVKEALEEFRMGKMVIMVDDEDRENEGDFVIPAELASPEIINFMIKKGGGLVCVATTTERLRELALEPMVGDNTSREGTNFAVAVDAHEGTTTGISAHDRARTVQVFTDDGATPDDLIKPGHVFPLGARPGGVLQRAGHTEGAVDLTRMAGFKPAAVICEILNDDGTVARLPDLIECAKLHDLKIITIRDIIAYRLRTEHLVKCVVTTKLPNMYGLWDLYLYEQSITGELHVAIVMGDPETFQHSEEGILVRVHSQCFTGDTLGSLRCDCGPQLHKAMEMIGREGRGVVLYLGQEGRGIGLKHKILAYKLQDHGRDTVEANEELGFKADLREYGTGAQILVDLGLKKIRLLTNNPRKIIGIAGYGLEVVKREPLVVGTHAFNIEYIRTKKEKMGHIIDDVLLNKTIEEDS